MLWDPSGPQQLIQPVVTAAELAGVFDPAAAVLAVGGISSAPGLLACVSWSGIRMGTLANFQQNRGVSNHQHGVARKTGDIAANTRGGESLGMKPGFERLTSELRFRHIVDNVEHELSEEMSADHGDGMIPKWMQEATKGKVLGQASSGQFMELLVYAATEGNLAHVQTALRSRLRFYYIRLMLLGEAMEGDLRQSTLPKLLKQRTPKDMQGPPLDELVERVILEISRRDSGLLLDLVERQSYLDEDVLETDPRDKFVRDAIGATFNLFFQWLVVILACKSRELCAPC